MMRKRVVDILFIFFTGLAIVLNLCWIYDNRFITWQPGQDVPNHLTFSIEFYDVLRDFIHGPLSLIDKIMQAPSLLFCNLPDCLRLYSHIVYLTSAPFYKFFGFSLFSASLSNFFYLFILLFSVYCIGTIIASQSVGIIAVLLVILHPYIFEPLRQYGLDLPLTAIVTLFFLLLLRFKGRIIDIVLLLLVASAGIFVKFQFIIFSLGSLLYLLYNDFIKDAITGVNKRVHRFTLVAIVVSVVIVVLITALVLRHASLTFLFSDIPNPTNNVLRLSKIVDLPTFAFFLPPFLLLYDILVNGNTTGTARLYRIILSSLTALLAVHLFIAAIFPVRPTFVSSNFEPIIQPHNPYRILEFLKRFFFDLLGIPLSVLFFPTMYSFIRNPRIPKKGYVMAFLSASFIFFLSFAYRRWFYIRFLMPLLPIIIVLIADWLVKISRKALGLLVTAGVLIFFFIQFYCLSYRYSTCQRAGLVTGDEGNICLFNSSTFGGPRSAEDTYAFDTLYAIIAAQHRLSMQTTDILIINLVPGSPEAFETHYRALLHGRKLQTCDLWMSPVTAQQLFAQFEFIVFKLPAEPTVPSWPSRGIFNRLMADALDPIARAHLLARPDSSNALSLATEQLYKSQNSFENIADIPARRNFHWVIFRKKLTI